MSQPKTILIIGAGASVPYGFPDGRKLFSHLRAGKWPEGHGLAEDAYAELTRHRFEFQQRHIARLAQSAAQSFLPSIDCFLQMQDFDADAVSHFVASWIYHHEAEWRERPLPVDYSCWVRSLLRATGLRGRDLVCKSDFGIITFNYDRMFEHLLTRYVASDMHSSCPCDVWHLISQNIPIVHLYGLPSQYSFMSDTRPSQIAFGSPYPAARLFIKSDQLQFNFQRTNSKPAFDKAASLVASAKRVLIAGVGSAIPDVADILHHSSSDPMVDVCTYKLTENEIDKARRILCLDGRLGINPGCPTDDAARFIEATWNAW